MLAGAVSEVVRDGRSWTIGTAADVGWIDAYTTVGLAITSAIPPVFDDYATVVLPETQDEQLRHDQAVIALLSNHSPNQPWWLGYLDVGRADFLFPEATRVSLYPDWPYVLVQAGPEQAVGWSGYGCGAFRSLPDLMFPSDRSWLVSTLWDDHWTCVGGSVALVDSLLGEPDVQARTRRVGADEDATPPGHRAI